MSRIGESPARAERAVCAAGIHTKRYAAHPWKERSQGRARHLKTGGRGEEGSSTPRRAAGDAAGEAHRDRRRATCLAARDGVFDQVVRLILRTRAGGGSAKRLHVYACGIYCDREACLHVCACAHEPARTYRQARAAGDRGGTRVRGSCDSTRQTTQRAGRTEAAGARHALAHETVSLARSCV